MEAATLKQLRTAGQLLIRAGEALGTAAELQTQAPVRLRTLGDYAAHTLRSSSGPLGTKEWAEGIRQLGYEPQKTPRNPNQLEQSLSALPHHDHRFVRVARGVYDLAERHPADARVTRSRRNPPWQEEELILALDLYLRYGMLQPSAPGVHELSEFLRKLPFHSGHEQSKTFRNPSGVAMKLANFAAIDPGYPGRGLSRGNAREQEIWARYANVREDLDRRVSELRSRFG
jgi:hypothetical protein